MGRAPKRYLRQSQTSLKSSLSIHLFVYIYREKEREAFFFCLSSLSLYIISIYRLYCHLRCGSSAARNLNKYHIRQMLRWQLVRPIPLGP